MPLIDRWWLVPVRWNCSCTSRSCGSWSPSKSARSSAWSSDRSAGNPAASSRRHRSRCPGQRAGEALADDLDVVGVRDGERRQHALVAVVVRPVELPRVHRRRGPLELADHADGLPGREPRVRLGDLHEHVAGRVHPAAPGEHARHPAVRTCLGGIGRRSNGLVTLRGCGRCTARPAPAAGPRSRRRRRDRPGSRTRRVARYPRDADDAERDEDGADAGAMKERECREDANGCRGGEQKRRVWQRAVCEDADAEQQRGGERWRGGSARDHDHDVV